MQILSHLKESGSQDISAHVDRLLDYYSGARDNFANGLKDAIAKRSHDE